MKVKEIIKFLKGQDPESEFVVYEIKQFLSHGWGGSGTGNDKPFPDKPEFFYKAMPIKEIRKATPSKSPLNYYNDGTGECVLCVIDMKETQRILNFIESMTEEVEVKDER